MCAVPWGVPSTVGAFSTVGRYHEYRGGYLEYRGGVQYRGDIMINVGRYLEYCGVFSTVGGYHEYCGGLS